MKTFHVLVSVHQGTEWNEWTLVPGFNLTREDDTDPRSVARDACMVAHHERTRKVQVQVYNPVTKLYDQEYTFEPLNF